MIQLENFLPQTITILLNISKHLKKYLIEGVSLIYFDSLFLLIKKMLLIVILFHFGLAQANFTVYSFSEWKILYNKTYNTEAQNAFRESIYRANIDRLMQSNCTTCGITKFTADTNEEIQNRNNLLLPSNIEELAKEQKDEGQKILLQNTNQNLRVGINPNSSLDWRDQGVITTPKAQGSCGTCWSFATVAISQSSLILQGRAFNNKFYSVDLSEQYLLKCTKGSSCSGGYLQNSIDKALQKGLPYESSFPYNPYGYNNGVCSTSDLITVSNATRVSKYYTSDDTIISMLTQGPIAIAISAVGWQSYSSGVYQCPRNSKINHAVVLIGYTPDYWIIKNSWGTDWGQSGFIYVTRNPLYNCGIGTAVHALFQSWFSCMALILLVLMCSI